MTTRSGASQAIEAVDEAVAMVSAARGLIGAKRNALESLYRNVTQSGENLQAAESKIRDVDMAKELAERRQGDVPHMATFSTRTRE
ncbi:flagellin [Sporomusa sphaeroides]|uniref:flagellin n=1 Tax=Sporomusa sphaeroides TaxID=47679 RepID=UPI002BA66D84|nr:flagellin [Sporomusa sphaeroides]HML34235.1 flagellin [Sporomusa sphaeroides]